MPLNGQVNAFLATLPLGVTRRDAELEDMIAAHLHDLLNERTQVQLKLSQWCGPCSSPSHPCSEAAHAFTSLRYAAHHHQAVLGALSSSQC